MVTTPGPVIEPENLPPQIVARHDEPFTLDFDHRRPLPEITAEFTQPDRVRLPPARAGEVPRPDRAVRQALRAVAAEHQREAPPLPDRQARLQAPHVPSQAIRPGGGVIEAPSGPVTLIGTLVINNKQGNIVGTVTDE